MARIAGVAVLALLMAGCGFFGDDEITVGTCLERVEEDAGEVLSPIDCERPHELEVVGILDADELGSDWPGDGPLSRWAFQECADAFEEYVGQPYGTSTLDLDIDGPTEQSWAEGDREVRCAATHLDGEQRRGSIAG